MAHQEKNSAHDLRYEAISCALNLNDRRPYKVIAFVPTRPSQTLEYLADLAWQPGRGLDGDNPLE